MNYTAVAKNIKISPRKVRLVVDSIRKQNLSDALVYLSLMNKRAAIPVAKAIKSALANATNTAQESKENLTIKEIMVGEGIMSKRYHYAGRGRMRPYKKRTSHITVVLTAKSVKPMKQEVIQPEIIEPKEERGKASST
jgi:large subunit ribosomal protein L22